MKYSRAALRRGAPRPQNAEARGRQARASADKADPRREAPQLPRLGHMRIISHLLHFVKPLFLVLFPALSPTFSVPLWLSPALLRLFSPPFAAQRARRRAGKTGAAERGADSVPKQTRKKPRRRGTGRAVGNAAARKKRGGAPPKRLLPPLPQSAGAQMRRASAYT